MEFSRERRWSFVDDSDPEGPREFFFYINEKLLFFLCDLQASDLQATFPSFPGLLKGDTVIETWTNTLKM